MDMEPWIQSWLLQGHGASEAYQYAASPKGWGLGGG